MDRVRPGLAPYPAPPLFTLPSPLTGPPHAVEDAYATAAGPRIKFTSRVWYTPPLLAAERTHLLLHDAGLARAMVTSRRFRAPERSFRQHTAEPVSAFRPGGYTLNRGPAAVTCVGLTIVENALEGDGPTACFDPAGSDEARGRLQGQLHQPHWTCTSPVATKPSPSARPRGARGARAASTASSWWTKHSGCRLVHRLQGLGRSSLHRPSRMRMQSVLVARHPVPRDQGGGFSAW